MATIESIDLNLVRSFVAVYEGGSFSVAAARLGVPRSTVSRAVAALEEALGVRLFHRTTRKVAASTAGQTLYERSAPILIALEASLADLPEREVLPSGTLRVTTTADLGAAVLAEAAARFTARYPDVAVEAQLSSTAFDLVRGGFDLALRVNRGRLADSSLVAQRVGTIVVQLYASPGYLARRGTPRRPADLSAHDWVGFLTKSPTLLSGAERSAQRDKRARILCDDMFFAREAVKAGAGIGRLPAFVADPEVAAGFLVRLLPSWTTRRGAVHLLSPGRKHQPRKVSAFREVLTELLRQRLP